MLIINYHEISPKLTPSPYVLSADLFRQHIEALISFGFSFTTLAEIAAGQPAAEHAHRCAITFDDGRLGAYEYGSTILQEHGIKAAYFVCSDWLEQTPLAPAEAYSDFMNWDHVAVLAARGNVIGSHGRSHLPFFDIDSETALREVADSKQLIERRLSAPCEHFASPFGHVNRAVMDLARDCGYRTLSTAIPGPNKAPYDLFRLRRLDSSNLSSLKAFKTEVQRCVDEQSRFNVALVKLPENVTAGVSEANAAARFDLVACLDSRSLDLCMQFGLPGIRLELPPGLNRTPARQRLMETHAEVVGNRRVVFTPLTFGGGCHAWASLIGKLGWF